MKAGNGLDVYMMSSLHSAVANRFTYLTQPAIDCLIPYYLKRS